MTRVAARRLCRDLAEYQGYSIKDAAGGTVFRNGGRDGRRVKFARIPRGSKHYPNGCPFCQMLASRGFVYRSELVAGGLDPDHYHSDCQCMVVPSWGKGSVEGYDPHDYDEGYQAYLDQDHSKHNQHVSETQRNRYDAWGRLQSGDGNRLDEKGALTDEDRALVRSKRTAAGNETRRADRSRMFFNLGVTEDEWKAMSEEQQKALLNSHVGSKTGLRESDLDASGERLRYSSKEDAVNFAVNHRVVGSKTYRARVARIIGDREFAEEVVSDLRSVLKKTDGTGFEEIYAYDLTAKERIARVIDQRRRLRVEPPASFNEAVIKRVAMGHEVVTFHNHPGSSIPSASDLFSARNRGETLSATFGHDGSFYVYRIVGEPAPGYILDGSEAANKALMRAYLERERRKGSEGALRDICDLYGVEIERVS